MPVWIEGAVVVSLRLALCSLCVLCKDAKEHIFAVSYPKKRLYSAVIAVVAVVAVVIAVVAVVVVLVVVVVAVLIKSRKTVLFIQQLKL